MKWSLLAAVLIATPAVAAKDYVPPSPPAFDLQGHCAWQEKMKNGQAVNEGHVIQAGFCLGFLRGVIMGALDAQDNFAKAICPTAELFNGDLEEIFMGWLRDHPDDVKKPDYVVAMAAFKRAFPCK